ncbi:hypothetical protein [Fodinibius salsisoli]|uniref:Curlin associated repeat-containing protein n=1 Tax=Fodinibius salsisoli TaxID=2820877 RepID=A0ABT3PMN0_9BACT|nr:hypothetical protein [Fodinibius salsisoli]MCW9707172.1 hypothetical protein [Fodinibius salsisoli]
MKKLILLLTLFYGVALSNVQAQVNIDQIDPGNDFDNGSAMTSEEDLLGIFLNSPFLSAIQQQAIDADQVARTNIEGDNNTAHLSQSGFNNVGIINIIGYGNEASLEQQGNGLFSAINVNGSSNNLDIEQNGNALQNLIKLDGSGLNYEVLQDPSGVEVTQTGSSIPLQIKRTGRVVPIIIRNN